jgi:hypothetical protein
MQEVPHLAPDIGELTGAGDAGVAQFAACQHGVVSRRQLTACGLGRGAIAHRVVVGRLHAVHRGVYAVGHSRISGLGRWMAAVLACGPKAVLSHGSAAALWRIRTTSAPRIDVTVEAHHRSDRAGITVHVARHLREDDRTVHEGIPVTTVARTLLDLAETVSPTQLRRAFEEADRLELIDMRLMDELLARARGRHGVKPLAALLLSHRGPPPLTRSTLERQFHELCRKSGLPLPSLNVSAAGLEVDALWRDERLVVELDGFEFHRGRAAFERDRQRDAALQMAGYRVLRVTHRRLQSEPTRVVEAVRALLDYHD